MCFDLYFAPLPFHSLIAVASANTVYASFVTDSAAAFAFASVVSAVIVASFAFFSRCSTTAMSCYKDSKFGYIPMMAQT